ncbi:MAG: ABC transporter ATP-binding protein [Christensenellales bacterium]
MVNVENLCKKYDSFALTDVSFKLERGYITGFIGANGAGKSTTLKSMLNIVRPDSGRAEFFGMNIADRETEIKQRISFTSGAFEYYPYERVGRIASLFSRFYKRWDDKTYRRYTEKFGIDEGKRVRSLSAGMKVKFALALALSHDAELLILDEPTGGLDPIARDELLEIFQRIIADGEKSILFSTHITSDLDKCADYILFMREGKLISDSTKDDLLDSHLLISGGTDSLTQEIIGNAVGIRKNAYSFTALIKRGTVGVESLRAERPNLEDIMVYYNRKDEEI